MTETIEEIITDAEIDAIHANSNFGTLSKRKVVAEGCLKAAFGYQSGHTQMTILQEHRLIQRRRGMSSNMVLAEKGKRYLRALFGENFHKMLNLVPERSSDGQ